jgi:hypothetical protein
MDSDPYGPAARGLRGYIALIARRLYIRPESCACEIGGPASAYLALERRLTNFPQRDAALVWDEETGWAIAIETGRDQSLTALTYLGEDVLPPVESVVRFVADALADRYPGQPYRQRLRCATELDDLDDRLAAYGSVSR